MGRTQTFDTSEVVRSARAVFWMQGYENASLPDLERATGLARSSLYNAFGSKRGLFDAAVRSYLDEIIAPRLRPLLDEPVAPDAITNYFTGLRASLGRADALPGPSGCLLVNTAGAPIAQDAAVGQVVADYRRDLESALSRGIDAHLPDSSDAVRRRLATVCTSLVVTAMTLARVDGDQAVASLDTALELLRSDES